MRVLIIDDDRHHGESLSDLLNARGHEAYFASSLGDADWLLDLFPFQVAILDYDMPGLTGPQVAAKLQERDPKLQSILMSARERPRKSPPELGALPFVSKPINVGQLLKLMNDLVSGSSLMVRLTFPLEPYRRRGGS